MLLFLLRLTNNAVGASPHEVNLFLVPAVCFHHVYSSLLFALVVFPMSVFLSIGVAFKICCLGVSCAVGGLFAKFYFSALASHVLMEAHVYQVAENNFLCRYICRLGPALKHAVFKFLVRLMAVYSLGCGRE